jgi:predicted ATPase
MVKFEEKMKIQVKNLGVLKQAEFSLGDLTIICGNNNTGKTYATYALFGFLSFWREVFVIHIHDEDIENLLADGVVHINLAEYAARAAQIITDSCKEYVQQLPMVFAAPKERFQQTEFRVSIDATGGYLPKEYERRIGSVNAERFAITKEAGRDELIITLLVEKERLRIPREVMAQFISDALKEIVFAHHIPNPFIASAERTGAAIFRKELNFPRNRLLEEMSQVEKNVNPIDLLFKVYQDYALPVKSNVDFTRELETFAKRSSFLAEQHSDLLADFAEIIGGDYTVTRQDELYYVPKGKRIKLSMDESSSGVRSLLDVGFYLKHVTQRGDLFMIDEPELNLHPENQRRMARLFARLINLGIKVFITTHSDYIIKELNTLIMLNHDKPHLKQIAEQEGYRPEELITAEQVKVYMAEEARIKIDGRQRRIKGQTLVPAHIDPESGIEARSFDKTIETMNRIQEEIIWGELP